MLSRSTFRPSLLLRSLAVAALSAGSGLLVWALPPDPTPTNESEARILEDIRYLASDQLQGRAAETPGLLMGAEFIANRWSALGLTTDLFNGKPFQEFSLDGEIAMGPAENNTLKITSPKGQTTQLALSNDFQPLALGANGAFSGKLVFAGYGITAKEGSLNYDDFEGIDVEGKVVIVVRKEPQQNDENSPFDGKSPSQYALFNAKEVNAAKHKAAALIIVNDRVSESSSPNVVLPVSGGGSVFTRDKVPTIFVRRDQVDAWFSQVGKSLSSIEEQIDADLKPRSFEFEGWQASGSVETDRKKLPSMNVVGLLPGHGELAKEYVVIGAHFDHVGMGGPGSLAPGTIEVHNGADDNASGTVCLLETARRLVESAKKNPNVPRRSIVFIAFSGEERGLLGSDYYCKHPRFELENTVAMLNLDMVGRLTENQLTIYGTGTAKEFDSIIDSINSSLAFKIEKSPEGMGPSDHQSFFLKKIPVLHFFTGLHDDYHRPSDDFDKINLSGIARITDMVTVMANQIAIDAQKPTFVEVKGVANPRASGPRRTRLGARFKTEDGKLVIDRVTENSLADKVGLQAGDKLLTINNQEVNDRLEAGKVVQELKDGDSITISVERGSEKVELKAEVGK